MTSSTRQSWRSLAFVGLGGGAAQFLGDGHIRAIGREPGADREGERVARVRGRAGQLQGRLAVQHQGPPEPDLPRREAGQDRKRGVNIAGVDCPGPGSEQVVLFGAEPDRPRHFLASVVMPDSAGGRPRSSRRVGRATGRPRRPRRGVPRRIGGSSPAAGSGSRVRVLRRRPATAPPGWPAARTPCRDRSRRRRRPSRRHPGCSRRRTPPAGPAAAVRARSSSW